MQCQSLCLIFSQENWVPIENLSSSRFLDHSNCFPVNNFSMVSYFMLIYIKCASFIYITSLPCRDLSLQCSSLGLLSVISVVGIIKKLVLENSTERLKIAHLTAFLQKSFNISSSYFLFLSGRSVGLDKGFSNFTMHKTTQIICLKRAILGLDLKVLHYIFLRKYLRIII